MPTALELFTATPRCHNCAQAVAAANGADEAAVAEMAFCGGGRAPGGLCGALHAACALCPEAAEDFMAKFAAACGDTTCRAIKQNARTPCTTCVEVADALLKDANP